MALVGVDLRVDAGTVDGGADGLVKSISGSLMTTLAVTMGGVSTSEQMITRGRYEAQNRVDGNEVGLNVITTEIWNQHFTFHISHLLASFNCHTVCFCLFEKVNVKGAMRIKEPKKRESLVHWRVAMNCCCEASANTDVPEV